jgi:hypothetical protein
MGSSLIGVSPREGDCAAGLGDSDRVNFVNVVVGVILILVPLLVGGVAGLSVHAGDSYRQTPAVTRVYTLAIHTSYRCAEPRCGPCDDAKV